ncbi:TetR family transcriptional regulator [Actinacidiphila acididurans]|uniref:TetR family transcriptional regulator n=1 Tax=Actinacidiphila acididurans TaxID=2784346 RepID=A0ABS2TLZ5_9ACTN|nr:TetR family transcriptional regulator [Actinacidiphila acididurans]MBM9504363.1 TetR family transcriptional regulator [Actinacidiphila acididurans]
MPARDPDDKRRRLLDAALAEFAEYGIGGARVDRLAKRAGTSAGLVYTYFEGKEGLFEAVYDAIVEQAVAGIPIDADDLPEYAGRLYDAGQQYPEVMRFMTWYGLERAGRRGVRPLVAASMADKTAAIEAAQRRGTVTGRTTAPELLALVLAVANMWQHQGEDVRGLVPAAERRRVVVESVRRLTAP